MFFILYYILYTIYCILYIKYYILYILYIPYILYTVYYILYTIYYTILYYTILFKIMYTINCLLASILHSWRLHFDGRCSVELYWGCLLPGGSLWLTAVCCGHYLAVKDGSGKYLH